MMTDSRSARPRLLDLFCGAGGAGVGYGFAGFDVTGVDLEPQPSYPLRFIRGDAFDVLREFGHLFDAIHASPPCQRYCAPSQYNGNRETYPDYVEPMRAALEATGKPWVMENTPGAPLRDPTILCGTMFGLRLYRHRLFESNVPLSAPEHPKHTARCARNGVIPPPDGFFTITGGKHSKAWVRAAAEAMSMPWASDDIRGVCEAVPPDYTLYIGRQMLAALEHRKAA